MVPKKSKAKAKPEEKDSKEVGWLSSQLEKLTNQEALGPAWLAEFHQWHKEQLAVLQDALEGGRVTAIPSDVKEGLDFYISQFEDGQSVSEEEFYIDKELYSQLLAPPEAAPEPAPYERRVATEEELQVVQQLKDWKDATPQVKKIMEANDGSAEVQESGLTRLGGLLADSKGSGSAVPAGCGLTPAALCPVVMEVMSRFPRDAKVQRVACSVLRGIVVTDGGCTVVADAGGAARAVEAMKAHLVDVEVCRMGAAVLYAMVQKTDPASPERLLMRTTKAHQVLAEVLQYHPTDQKLDRACRVTMPELKG